MTFPQPADVGRDRAVACLDPAMIAIDRGVRIRRSGFGIVEEQRDIAMQGSLVSFEGQDIVAALIDDPPGDVALTVEGIDGHDRSLQRQHFQQLGHGGDLVGFFVSGDLRQDEALIAAPGGDHVQRRLATGGIEGAAQNLAVDRDDALGVLSSHFKCDSPGISSQALDNHDLMSSIIHELM